MKVNDMNGIIEEMLSQHNHKTLADKKNSIKEIVQEIILCGLFRSGFFKEAAFYGGTALRIFYGLDRFSEDLDFSLISPDPNYSLEKYLPFLERELGSYGFKFEIEMKHKNLDSGVQSAFVKGNTREHILICYSDRNLAKTVIGNEMIKIKFEIDTLPPPYAGYDIKYKLLPIPYEIRLYDMPSLFAGKLHAVICRAWKNRVKGRDLYDYLFYMARGTTINLKHLNARLVDSGFEGAREDLTLDEIKRILERRFISIDYQQAKEDVLPFIQNPESLRIWSKEFFLSTIDSLKS